MRRSLTSWLTVLAIAILSVSTIAAQEKGGSATAEAEKNNYELELSRLQEIVAQIEKCTVRATQPGQVVHAVQPHFDRVVIDRMEASAQEIREFGNSVTIGLDLGGAGREFCSYLIDALPRLDGLPSNASDIGYLVLPDALSTPKGVLGRVLVSFGGEDGGQLSEATAHVLVCP